MERVEGIGGFFFVAADPAGLARWYAQHLGVAPVPGSDGSDGADAGEAWQQAAGATAFAPMPAAYADAPHLGPTGWGINFRVGDLDAMVAQLRHAGIEVAVDEGRYDLGRFAQLHDPEGNAVQLWQPAVRRQSEVVASSPVGEPGSASPVKARQRWA